MRTVEAVWEKRNVGVECFEIEVGKNDSVDEVLNIIHNRNEKYFVAKVLAGRVDVLLALQKEGFQFMETNIQTEMELSEKPKPPAMCAKLIERAGYHFGSDKETKRVIDEIRNGYIFSTDKVALDPYFSQKIAGQRYAFWAQDVLASGNAKMIITEYDGEDVGFSIVINKGNYFDGFLGGLFADYLNSGLGFANAYTTLKAVFDLGGRRYISGVSSNNFQMLKLHMMFGLRIRRLTYNLIKHV